MISTFTSQKEAMYTYLSKSRLPLFFTAEYAISLILIAAVVGVNFLLKEYIEPSNLLIIQLIPVLGICVLFQAQSSSVYGRREHFTFRFSFCQALLYIFCQRLGILHCFYRIRCYCPYNQQPCYPAAPSSASDLAERS